MCGVKQTCGSWNADALAHFVAVAIGVLLVPLTAGAQERVHPRLHHATAGYGATLQEKAVMPVMLQVRNEGPQRTAEFKLTGPAGLSGQVMQITRAVDLPARSHLQFEVPFMVDQLSGTSGIPIGPVLDVELGDGDRVRWDRFEIIGRTYPSGARTLVVADGRGADYRWTGRGHGDDEREADNRFVIPPAHLPRQPVSLSFADVLILGSLGGHRLDAAQVAALREWVASGGLLIMVPAIDTHADDLAELEPMLPGAWLGGGGIHSLPVPGHEAGHVTDPGKPFFSAPLLARPEAQVIGDPDAPLALRRSHGRGVVMMLGFDAGSEAFQTWPGAPEFWRQWIPADAGTPGQRAEPFDASADRAQELMRSLAGARAASRGLVATYLLTVLAVFGLLLMGGPAVGRAEWGWSGAMLFSVLAGLGLLALVRRDAPEQASLVEIAYVRAASDGHAMRVEGGLGFYSPVDATLQASLQTDRGYLRPGRTGIRPPPLFPIAWADGRLAIDGLRVRAGELRHALGYHDLIGTAGSPATLIGGPAGLQVRVPARPAGVTLHGAYFHWRRMAVPLGTVPDAGWDSPWLRPESSAAGFRFTTRELRGEVDELRDALRSIVFPGPVTDGPVWTPRLMPVRADRMADLESPALYGFSDAPVWPLSVDRPAADRRALVLWRIPVELDLGNDVLVWPRGTLPREIRAQDRIIAEVPGGAVTGFGAARVVFEFALPAISPEMELESMRVFFDAQAEGYRFRAMIPEPGGDAIGLEPAVPARVSMQGRRFGPADRIRVEVEVLDERGMGERVQRWVIAEVELELAGRRIDAVQREERP